MSNDTTVHETVKPNGSGIVSGLIRVAHEVRSMFSVEKPLNKRIVVEMVDGTTQEYVGECMVNERGIMIRGDGKTVFIPAHNFGAVISITECGDEQ